MPTWVFLISGLSIRSAFIFPWPAPSEPECRRRAEDVGSTLGQPQLTLGRRWSDVLRCLGQSVTVYFRSPVTMTYHALVEADGCWSVTGGVVVSDWEVSTLKASDKCALAWFCVMTKHTRWLYDFILSLCYKFIVSIKLSIQIDWPTTALILYTPASF